MLLNESMTRGVDARSRDDMSKVEINIESETLSRAPRKVQLGLGLPPTTLARLDRLRACTGLTRGDVVDAALCAGGLAEIEAAHDHLIKRFNALAKQAGQGWEEYAHEYAKTWASKTYPPTVGALEKAALLESMGAAGENAESIEKIAPPTPRRVTLRDMT